jgi:osmoprotectant transport system permease protein
VTDDPRIALAFARLPDYLSGHVLVSVLALVLGLAVSFPLALIARNRPRLARVLLAAASIVQTVPGLALLALFYPLLLALGALSARFFGLNFSALGLLPSVLALALYSMLPVLRNTLTGLDGIAPTIRDAAIGVGMTRRQSLMMIELPLALPVIMAGIRTAAVWVIGTATLATPIGQTTLGNYIFTGLQTQNWVFVLFGCAAAAILALIVDQALALIERGLSLRRRGSIAAGGTALVIILLSGLLPALSQPRSAYVVGAKTFTEQHILADLITDRLETANLAATEREGLGSSIILNALATNEIDVYVEYSGTLWANEMHRTEIKPREEVLAEVARWLKETRGITMLGGLGFENAYALAMRRDRADALGIHSITDLARHAQAMTIAGDYEFFARPEWTAIRETYGLGFREQREMQPEFMYAAVAARDVDVIAAYSSDGLITKYDLVVLDDDRRAIPPYDAILLISPKRADDARLAAALHPLLGAIDVRVMREANLRASGSSADAAARWLAERIAASAMRQSAIHAR